MFDSIPMSVYGSVMGLLFALAAAAKPYPPVDSISGLDSYVERSSIEVATSPSSWNAVWQRHKGITPIGTTNGATFPSIEQAPSVDFDQNEVLVIFGGLASEEGYTVVDSEKTSKEIMVRIAPLPLGGNGNRLNSAFKANPFAFIMFKRTKLPFSVQMSRRDQNGNVQWVSVGRAGGTSKF